MQKKETKEENTQIHKTRVWRLPNKKKIILAGVDLAFVMLALWASKMLHTGRLINPLSSRYDLASFYFWLLLSGMALIVFSSFGFYRHLWRFASLPQYMSLFVGTLTHAILLVLMMPLTGRTIDIPFAVSYWMIVFLAVGMIRVSYRLAKNPGQLAPAFGLPSSVRRRRRADMPGPVTPMIRVLVVGAGNAGSQIIRNMFEYRADRLPVALIDDDRKKHDLSIYGVPVVGGRECIVDAVKKYQAKEILLAMPSASRQTLLELVRICNQTPCRLKILPSLSEMVNGEVSIRDIKDVEIGDLLCRDEVLLDIDSIADYLTRSVVLVTGAGGSIGSELCRQVARFNPKNLILFDIYENNAYELQQELRELYKDEIRLRVVIGSVRDMDRLNGVMNEYKPHVVFHAAAHKHVPLMEDNPGEAVKNNIIGTYNTARAAGQAGVERFVLISTDKAVNPTNVMGATKRIAELTIQTLGEQYPDTRFAAVRFGNVLGSNGSVVPLFKQQIHQSGRVTVTHPDITRYFMTIPEAARLVIQAGALASGGEIFALDMGEPVKIVDLARELIVLSGLEPDIDVKIEFTGLRPGEKMFEELYQDKENMVRTRHEKIFVMKPVSDREAVEKEIARLEKVIGWKNEPTDALIQKIKAHAWQ